ncbi:7843_t:CDS:2, partial [Acaulospora colombiana]
MTDETTDRLLTDVKRSYELLEENTSVRSIPEFLAHLGSEFMPCHDKLTVHPMIITILENPVHVENEDKCDLSDEEDFDGEKVEDFHHHEKVRERGSKKLMIAIGISSLFFVTELIGGLISGSLALLSDSFHLLSGSCQNQDNVTVRAALLHALGDLLSSLGVLISSIVIIYDPSKMWVDPLCTFLFSALVMATTFGILRSSVRVLMEATPFHIDPQAVESDLKAIEGVKSAHDLH